MGSDISWCSCAKSQGLPTNLWLYKIFILRNNGGGAIQLSELFPELWDLAPILFYYISLNHKPFVGQKQKTWKGFTCGKCPSLISVVIHNDGLRSVKDQNPLLTCSQHKLYLFSFSLPSVENFQYRIKVINIVNYNAEGIFVSRHNLGDCGNVTVST